MTKKLFLAVIAAISLENIVYSSMTPASTAATKAVQAAIENAIKNTYTNFNAGLTQNTTPSVQTNAIHINDTQANAITKEFMMNNSGGQRAFSQNQFSQIQTYLQNNPEIMYQFSQATEAGNRAQINKLRNDILKESAEITVPTSSTPNRNDSATSSLISSISTLQTNVSQTTYNAHLLEPFNNQFANVIQSPLNRIEREVSIVLNGSLKPQDATKLKSEADKLDKIKTDLLSFKKSSTKPMAAKNIDLIAKNIDATKESLKDFANKLQSTPTATSKNVTALDFKNMFKNFNSSEKSIVTLPQENPLEIGLETDSIAESVSDIFTNTQKELARQVHEGVDSVKNLSRYSRENATIPAGKKLKFVTSSKEISSNYLIFIKTVNELTKLSHNLDSLLQMKQLENKLLFVAYDIFKSLESMRENIKDLLPSEQQEALEYIIKVIEQIERALKIVGDTTFTLKTIDALKDVLPLIKKEANLAQFVSSSSKDIQAIETAAQNINRIFLDSKMVTVDKEASGLTYTLESRLKNYNKFLSKLLNIKDLNDLSQIAEKLKTLELEIITIIKGLQGKIDSLPDSPMKRDAQKLYKDIETQFAAQAKALQEFSAKAKNVEQTHLFVNLNKDSIEIGYATIINKYEGAKLSITLDRPESSMTLKQLEALEKLKNSLEEMQSDLKEIQRVKTSFEMDQLTEEFFKAKKLLDLRKIPSSIIPVDPSSIIAISEPSLAEISGPNLATHNEPSIVSSDIVLYKYEETLKETLKTFGMKLALGLTAAGTVTWIAEKLSPEDDANLQPTNKTDIADLIAAGIDAEIKKPTTSAEFITESNKVLDEIAKLKNLPAHLLEAAIKKINIDMSKLNLQAFKETGIAFLEKVRNMIRTFIITPINNVRAGILHRWNNYLDTVEKELQEDMDNTQTSTSIKPISIADKISQIPTIQEIHDFLSQWNTKRTNSKKVDSLSEALSFLD